MLYYTLAGWVKNWCFFLVSKFMSWIEISGLINPCQILLNTWNECNFSSLEGTPLEEGLSVSTNDKKYITSNNPSLGIRAWLHSFKKWKRVGEDGQENGSEEIRQTVTTANTKG